MMKKTVGQGIMSVFPQTKKCLSAGENSSLYALGICKEEDDMQ